MKFVPCPIKRTMTEECIDKDVDDPATQGFTCVVGGGKERVVPRLSDAQLSAIAGTRTRSMCTYAFRGGNWSTTAVEASKLNSLGKFVDASNLRIEAVHVFDRDWAKLYV